jgi:membrane fusion protein (multidrug efflux system)
MATACKPDIAAPPKGPGVVAPPSGGRRRVVIPILVVLGIAAAYWAYSRWSYGRSHITTDDAAIDGHMVPVLAKVSGYVQTVTVSDNQHVAADSVLVQVDPAEYSVRLAQAEADLAAARAAAGGNGQAEAAVETASGNRASLDAQIAAARANDTKARADLGRMQELAAKSIVSKQQLDAAKAAADAASANLSAFERQAAAAGGSVTSAQAGVRLAQARLQAAQAAVDNAKLQLTYARIVAPAAGIVSRKQVERGQLVQAGQPLLTIVSDTGVYVTANFKETQLASLHVGQAVEVDVDAYPGTPVRGRVESLSAATGSRFALLPPDNATGNFTKIVQRVPVRIAITQPLGPDRPLRPGMSATVKVEK